MEVFISTTTFSQHSDESLRLLALAGISYSLNPYGRKMTEDEILNILQAKEYVGLIAGTERLSRKVLEGSKSLRVISRVGVGLDNVDLDAAGQLDIKVFNTPDAPVQAVAELTLGLILNVLRKITLSHSNIRKGIWKKEAGFLLKGKTLGVIGMGRIGRRVAEIAQAFGARVIFSDIQRVGCPEYRQLSLEELLRSADIVSIHASAKGLILSKKYIAMMKPSAILINVARGNLVDEEALYQSLVEGRLAAAGLDTFLHEPYKGKLTDCDNVVLTPHIGSYAREARLDMEVGAVENLIQGLSSKVKNE